MQSFFSRSDAKGTRSTALHSLQWALGLMLAALPTSIYVKAPDWILIALCSAIGVVLLVFLSAYIYFLFRNPDALRSEQFTLSKMAIEKGLVGDSVTGISDPRQKLAASQPVITIGSNQGAAE